MWINQLDSPRSPRRTLNDASKSQQPYPTAISLAHRPSKGDSTSEQDLLEKSGRKINNKYGIFLTQSTFDK